MTATDVGRIGLDRLKPYAEYKESGVPWLGKIPSHWDIHRLKNVARLAYGSALAAEERGDGNVPVFGSNGRVGRHSAANTRSPVIVVGRKGSYGKVSYSVSAVFAIDTTFFIDMTTTTANIRWLFYLIGQLRLDEASEDSAVPGLSRERAYAEIVPVPQLQEQNEIADFLDRETGKIDELVSKKERLIELLQEKRTALITHAVTKGLNPSAPMKDSGIPWLGKIPAHWVVAPLYVRYQVALGKMLDQKQISGDNLRPYLRNVNVQWDRVNVNDLPQMDFSESERRAYALREGDLLVCEGGEIGRTAVWRGELEECFYQKAVHRLRPVSAGDAPRFFFYVMYSAVKAGRFVAGANPNTIDHLTAVQLKRHRFPFPPHNEQLAIADFLDRETGKIDELVAKIREGIEKLREYRAALITAAVTGKIDVREDTS